MKPIPFGSGRCSRHPVVLSLNAIIGTPLESVISPYPIVDPQAITVF